MDIIKILQKLQRTITDLIVGAVDVIIIII